MPRTTTNLLLKVWNDLTDKFNHTELAQNWDRVDTHDHTGSGKGLKLPAGAFEPNAVRNVDLAPTAVDTNVIVDGAVTEQKITPSAVTESRLRNEAVTGSKLAVVTINAFLKLLVPGDHKLAIGVATGAWMNGFFRKTVQHNLGTVPIFATFTAVEQGSTIYFNTAPLGVSNLTASQMDVMLQPLGTFNGDGGNTKFFWIAIS